MGMEAPPVWVYLLALLPLAVLQVTGLWLFVLPYARRSRSKRVEP
jgi:ABC-type transporter Mla subunit MlaD